MHPNTDTTLVEEARFWEIVEQQERVTTLMIILMDSRRLHYVIRQPNYNSKPCCQPLVEKWMSTIPVVLAVSISQDRAVIV